MIRPPETQWGRFWLGIMFLPAHILYIITNRILSGGITPDVPLDAQIPLWPIWIFPYLGVLFWWIGTLIWMMFRMDDARLYTRTVLAWVVDAYTSIAVFVLYPNYVDRPAPIGTGLAADILRYTYSNDHEYNALPSMHISITTLLVIALWQWQPKLRLLWVGILVATIFAVLFTKQHYVLDVVVGLAWGVVSTVIAQRLTRPA